MELTVPRAGCASTGAAAANCIAANVTPQTATMVGIAFMSDVLSCRPKSVSIERTAGADIAQHLVRSPRPQLIGTAA